MSDVNNAADAVDETVETGAAAPAEAVNPGDQAAPNENDADDAGADDDEDAERRGPDGRFQKRIGKVVREREEARREAAYYKGQLEATQRREPPAEAPKPQAPKEPVAKDFTDYEEYLVAKAEFRIEQKQAAKAAEAEQARGNEGVREAVSRFEGAKTEARKSYADFDTVVNNPNLRITQAMAMATLESEKSADIAYYLGTHPDEAAKIAALSPIAQAVAIGRLEATVQKPAAKTVTTAPAPPSRLKGGDVPSRDPSRMSNDEYRSWRAKQDA